MSMRMHRRMVVCAVVLLSLFACSVAVSTRRGGPPAGGASRFTRVAELEDGPSEIRQKAKQQANQQRQQQQSNWMDGGPGQPAFSDADRARHLAAVKAARDHATQYVRQFHQKNPTERQTAARASPPPSKHASSGYDKISRVQEKERQRKQQQKQQQAKPKHQHAKPHQQPQQQPFDFADAGASFVEESVRMQDPFPKQEWTYSDTESPPAWLVPEADAKQGVPTTKPPPVPRMPPPPPPTPTPTWMSPFDEHQTPVFPQSSTPAPFYGMGPPPPMPPANYLPLDTFMSPAPEEGA